MNPSITNIQRFCIHDGEGIRTTVFFEGCQLRCQWCHNPEDQPFIPHLMLYPARCTGCLACVDACPQGAASLSDGRVTTDRARCVACGACADACLYDARSMAGKPYELDALVRLLCRDEMFYQTSGGGVTLSGGEVMQQPFDYVLALAKRLHARGISVGVDTCGEAPYERFSALLPYVSFFLYDIKHMDAAEHKRLTGVDNRRILDNLAALCRDGARVIVRLPLIAGVNDDSENVDRMIAFLKQQGGIERVCLLPYHTAGSDKYERMDQPLPREGFAPPSRERLTEIADKMTDAGFGRVQIGG